MDESTSQDLDRLLGELEDEYGEEEPLAPEAEQLLRDLHPDNPSATRQRAVQQLGRLDASHPRILRALITFKESDESQFIRSLAAAALQAPVHQELLRRHPGLEGRVVAGMAPQPVPEEPKVRAYAPRPPATPAAQPVESLTWSEVWVQALTQPSVQTFERLLRDPNATDRTAYAWMAVVGLISYLLSWLLSAVLIGSSGGGVLGVSLGDLAGYGICGAIVAPIGAVLGLMISAGVTHALASMLGGRGTYSELAYAYATYQAPLALITAVLSVIPYLSYLSFAIALYIIVLNVLAVKAVHDLGTGAAIVCALVLPILAAIVIIACIGLGIAALVAAY